MRFLYFSRHGFSAAPIKLVAALVCCIASTGSVSAAVLQLPGDCSNLSACISAMSSGDTLRIADGSYSNNVSGLKANTVIEAQNDGMVKFTGSFNPGNSGFTMRGIVVESNQTKSLGKGNRYERMSFVGGPSCGNTVNSDVNANTTIVQSAFYGLGGRYLVLAYETNNVTMEDVILRPDGGWGATSGCAEYEPHAAYNMYDTDNFDITGAIVVDAISTAHNNSEGIGGQCVNTHNSHGGVGTIRQSAIVTSESGYGSFSSEGNGSHNVNVVDSVARGNADGWGLYRNVNGTTTATRFDSDKKVEAFKGSVNRTSGANLTLNMAFLNDPRWKREMCTDAGVSRGFCGSGLGLGDYVSNELGLSNVPPAPAPLPPEDFQ